MMGDDQATARVSFSYSSSAILIGSKLENMTLFTSLEDGQWKLLLPDTMLTEMTKIETKPAKAAIDPYHHL